MKIRTDFVTNSSSSSYVIAYKTGSGIDEDTLSKYPFLRDYEAIMEAVLFSEDEWDTNKGVVLSTAEEYEKFIMDYYGYKDKKEFLDDYEKDYNKVVSYIEQGYKILRKSVDYNNSYFIDMINNLVKSSDNFVILEED